MWGLTKVTPDDIIVLSKEREESDMSKITVNDLYRLCFCYPEFRKQLKEDWRQIYDWLLEEQGNKVEGFLPSLEIWLIENQWAEISEIN